MLRELAQDIFLSACSVGAFLASQSSHLDTASFYYLPARAFSPFFFLRVPRARNRGRARRRRGCQRALAGRGRSVVAVSVARRRARHEGSVNGLCLASWCGVGYDMYESIRLVGLGLQNKTQAVLNFSTKLNITERASQSERQHCRAGERRPR